MILINNKEVKLDKFPDGTLLLKENINAYIGIDIFFQAKTNSVDFTWRYENEEELIALIYLVNHFRSHGFAGIHLKMPYIPNARMDRVKNSSDVFTLKYFAEIINWLNFETVSVLDPHSYVSEALINNLIVDNPSRYIQNSIVNICERKDISTESLMLFYPDEGAMKRYSNLTLVPYAFGIKKRDWATGQIQGLDVSGAIDEIKDKVILIVDDICSKGGTFYHSAKRLKELGAKEIYLYVTHCENTILKGELLTSGLIEKVYTTNSIFTKEHEKIEVFKL